MQVNMTRTLLLFHFIPWGLSTFTFPQFINKIHWQMIHNSTLLQQFGQQLEYRLYVCQKLSIFYTYLLTIINIHESLVQEYLNIQKIGFVQVHDYQNPFCTNPIHAYMKWPNAPDIVNHIFIPYKLI